MTDFDRIRFWAGQRNLIDGSHPKQQFLKTVEETGELAQALAKGNLNAAIDAIGDVVVTLTIIAEQMGVSIEECIHRAYLEIKDRKGVMRDGIYIKEEDLLKEARMIEMVKTMKFGKALKALRRGEHVTRYNWNGGGMFLILVDDLEYFDLVKDGVEMRMEGPGEMLLLSTAFGSLVPWCPSQTDILADDWYTTIMPLDTLAPEDTE